jgi:hypothetical protein
MSTYNQTSYFETTVSSGVTLSDSIDLGRGWGHVSLEIPSMPSGTDIFIQGSTENGTGVYRRHHHRITNSSDNPTPMNIDSSITNCFVPLEFVRVRYLKIELGTAMTANAAIFRVVCA